MALPHSRPLYWGRASIRPSLPSLPISRARSSSNLRVTCSAAFPHPKFRRPYTTVLIVPTGVGASIGGFAGDALPVARTLASVADCVISHPNVGLVLDAGMEEELRIRHLQVADATRASLGLPIVEYMVTDAPLKVETWIDPKCGKSTGRIKHPDSLLRAVQTLVSHSHINAVAVVGRFPDDDMEDMEDYRLGKGVDSLAGVEAIISHLVVKEFQIPCAHAPAVSPIPLRTLLSPRSAAEELGYTFLPCVLAGLSCAPQYVTKKHGSLDSDCIAASNVDSVMLPADACGGDGALAFARSMTNNKPLIIAVQENETVLDDTPEKFGIEVVKVLNYWEAIGVIAAHKAGVNPKALKREGINNVRCLSMSSSNDRKASLPSALHDRVYSL
uniref:Uncharacterized protein LOC105041190 isoform X2 n=1 Tax=Elaeis guineensis var. tenera TaxID=51953 RepID=A0A6I9QW92_ELAGV|nr:uncharacterized protein LOC105041190 isoform X2 [Elaeis guineensis]